MRFHYSLALFFSVVATNTLASQNALVAPPLLPGAVDATASSISADGGTIAGTCRFDNGGGNYISRAFRWSASSGLQDLGLLTGTDSSSPAAISADGSTVVGTCQFGPPGNIQSSAFRWTAATGVLQPLCPSAVSSTAAGVSRDGNVIAGTYTDTANIVRPFLWTPLGGAQPLPLPTAPSLVSITGISPDGSVVCGYTLTVGSPLTSYLVRWTNGVPQTLGVPFTLPPVMFMSADGTTVVHGSTAFGSPPPLQWSSVTGPSQYSVPTGSGTSSVFGISSTGEYSVGRVNLNSAPFGTPNNRLMRWHGTKFLDLGAYPATGIPDFRNLVSSDGSLLIGGAITPWAWTVGTGTIPLSSYLQSQGVDTAGWQLSNANTVTAGDRSILGNGTYNGQSRPWIAHIHPVKIDRLDGCDFASSSPPFEVQRDNSVPRIAGTSRNGATADGASRLVVRCSSDTPGTYRASFINQSAGEGNGELAIPGSPFQEFGTLQSPAIQVGSTPVWDAAFTYRPPTDYARSAYALVDSQSVTREVAIKLEFQEQGTSSWREVPLVVKLRRPPVILAHGLWSDSSAWSGAFTTLASNQDQRFSARSWNYCTTNSDAFQVNAARMGSEIEAARNLSRSLGYASTKVDWIGHSMGGILPRVYYTNAVTGRGKVWTRRDNFGDGDIHKLITLNSPHFGSPLAKLLKDIKASVWATTYLNPVSSANSQPAIDDAVSDLVPGSTALSSLVTSPIPSYTLVGTGGEPMLGFVDTSLDAFSRLPGMHKGVATVLGAVSITLDLGTNALFGSQPHDLVVLAASQHGGLYSPYSLEFSHWPGSTHFSAHSDGQYYSKVVSLLEAPVSDFASSFPGLAPASGPSTSFDPPLPPVHLALANQPTSSTPGAVSITVSGLGPYLPSRVILITPWGSHESTVYPFVFTVPVPPGTFGNVGFTALAVDANNNPAGSTPLIVDFGPIEPLANLAASPSQLELNAPYARAVLDVHGTTTTGNVLDLRRAAAGTVYSSSDSNVATVSRDGEVSARRPGQTTITVTNGMMSATVSVTVSFAPVVGYGIGTPGTGTITPTLGTAGGNPFLGNLAFQITTTKSLGGSLGLLVAGWDSAQFDLLGCTLWFDPSNLILFSLLSDGAPGVAGDGDAALPLPIPNDVSWDGLRVYWQAVFLDAAAPEGFSATPGLATTFGA